MVPIIPFKERNKSHQTIDIIVKTRREHRHEDVCGKRMQASFIEAHEHLVRSFLKAKMFVRKFIKDL
jgi:hypothetical protein